MNNIEVARQLLVSESLLVASPEYLARQGTPRHPSELAQHQCLSIFAERGVTRWRFEAERENIEVEIKAPFAVSDADSLIALARQGLGIAMVTDWLACSDLAAGSLQPLMPDYLIAPRGTPITALYQSRRYLPLKVRVFVDFMAEKMREFQDAQLGGKI